MPATPNQAKVAQKQAALQLLIAAALEMEYQVNVEHLYAAYGEEFKGLTREAFLENYLEEECPCPECAYHDAEEAAASTPESVYESDLFDDKEYDPMEDYNYVGSRWHY